MKSALRQVQEQSLQILVMMAGVQHWVAEHDAELSRESKIWFTGYFLLMACWQAQIAVNCEKAWYYYKARGLL